MAASIVVTAAGSTACAGTSRETQGSCFDAWNARSNASRRTAVAGRFTAAEVSRWRAQAGAGTGNVGGRPSFGCSYLFHTSSRYLTFSGTWRMRTLRWGVPPTIRGRWSAEQQAAVRDNATVAADGRLQRSD
jgi:hypothetical protein